MIVAGACLEFVGRRLLALHVRRTGLPLQQSVTSQLFTASSHGFLSFRVQSPAGCCAPVSLTPARKHLGLRRHKHDSQNK